MFLPLRTDRAASVPSPPSSFLGSSLRSMPALILARKTLQALRRLQTKFILGLPIVDNVLLNNIGIGCKLSALSTITHSITTYASVQQENMVKDLELFINSKKDELISVKEICTIYLDKLCRSGNLFDAAYLLRHLCSRYIYPSLNTYNILLAGAVDSNNFHLFSEVFKSLLLSNHPPDAIAYSKLAEAFGKVDDSDLVFDFIKEVSEITVDRDCTVINRIIFVNAKFGQIAKSLMVFEALKKLQLEMDTVTFNTVLGILGKSGRINEMMSEFVVMKDLGHIPDIVTYSTLINCLRRFGRLDICKAIASEMSEKGIQMDLLTYTALIDVFGRAGYVEDAFRLFEEMKELQCPSVYVYRSIVSNLKRAGKFELALSLSSEMNLNTTKLAGPEDFKENRKRRRRKVKHIE